MTPPEQTLASCTPGFWSCFQYWEPPQLPTPTQPAKQPVEPLRFLQEPLENAPGHSDRIRVPATRPDNVYGNRPPVDIFGGPQRNKSPGPSGSGTCPTNNPSSSMDLAKIAQDGGAKFPFKRSCLIIRCQRANPRCLQSL